jgi:NitT/TauT family transport system ATP-binding protein
MMRMHPVSEFSSTSVPAGAAPIAIELSDTSVTFGRGGRAVPALSKTKLRIADGEFVALVGPSGCGKSTIQRLVSGLVQPTTGVVIVGGREVAARALRVGMAFQNPTMLPWMTIERNIMLPLKIVEPYRSQFRKLRKTAFRDKANALLEQVGLKGFGSRYPWQLSGGMLQRANLCRALIHEPRMLLLDEPFGALDQFTREELWSILQNLWMRHKPTVLLVTHDLREAGFSPDAHLRDECAPRPHPRRQPRRLRAAAHGGDDVRTHFVALNQKLRTFIEDARSAPAQGAV